MVAVHWSTMRIVGNEPSECWEPLSCCLDINDSFDHSAHIVSIANDLVKVEGLLPRVAPDRAGIGVTSILCQIIQTHATSAQQGQAGTAATMTGNPAPGVRPIHTGFGTERRDPGAIEKLWANPFVSATEEIVDVLVIFPVKEGFLPLGAFCFPGSDGKSRVVRNPDPKCSSVLPGANIEVENLRNLLFILPLFPWTRSEQAEHCLLDFIHHLAVPVFSHAVQSQP